MTSGRRRNGTEKPVSGIRPRRRPCADGHGDAVPAAPRLSPHRPQAHRCRDQPLQRAPQPWRPASARSLLRRAARQAVHAGASSESRGRAGRESAPRTARRPGWRGGRLASDGPDGGPRGRLAWPRHASILHGEVLHGGAHPDAPLHGGPLHGGARHGSSHDRGCGAPAPARHGPNGPGHNHDRCGPVAGARRGTDDHPLRHELRHPGFHPCPHSCPRSGLRDGGGSRPRPRRHQGPGPCR